jgi:SPP1 gp7 family putative phage head morphogenesis protein
MLLSKEETKALIDGVWTGKYNQTKLPYWLFNKMANGYEGAAVRGWGNTLGNGALQDIELELSMQHNLYYFAAHKTAQQLNAMKVIQLASKGKYDFVKKALMINEKYNRFWYDTEYNVTKRIARAGREWRRIEAHKDIYPKLRFIAVQDGNARVKHQAIHGTILPVDDPFWKLYFPPLDWNCRCRVERLFRGADTDLSQVKLPAMEQQFNERVNDSKKIWHDSHPYFGGLTQTVKNAVTRMAKQKIAAEQPWEFTSPQELKSQLKAKYPNIDFYINVDKVTYDQYVKGFNLPRFIDNMAESFSKTEIGGIVKPCKIRDITIEHDMYSKKLHIQVHGNGPSGGSITLHRDFFFENSVRTVEHAYFKIPNEIQGGGFSKQLFQHLYKEYAAAKVQRIKVHANLDVGGYTWARYGFRRGLSETKGFVYNRISDPALKAKCNEAVALWEKANPGDNLFPMNDLATIPGMKEKLLGTDWYGQIDLRSKEQREYFEDYLHGKNKPEYKEELTEAMHSEFQIDAETEIKHRCFVVFSVAGTEDMAQIERVATEIYQVDMKDIARYIEDYKLLKDDSSA